MTTDDNHPDDADLSKQVGQRLRAIRHAHHLSLDDVEKSSSGRWTAATLQAYEQGTRNLSLTQLHAMASFYGMSTADLLGEPPLPESPGPARIMINLQALPADPDAEPMLRFLRSILAQRGDHGGQVLSLRDDDLRAMSALLKVTEHHALHLLRTWGALIEETDPGLTSS